MKTTIRINESDLRRIIEESYVSLSSMISRFIYQIPSDIGYKGDISGSLCDLSALTGYDSNDINEIFYYIDKQYECPLEHSDEIEQRFLNFIQENCPTLANIYNGYAKAMSRRRPDSVLNPYRFMRYALDDASAFVHGRSVLLGQLSNGYFKVSHFCPATMREGVELLKKVSEYDNVIFTVTEDLSPMLIKIGLYGDEKAQIPMIFRDMLVQKHILTTDKNLLLYVLKNISTDKISELLSFRDDERDYRKVVRQDDYGLRKDAYYGNKQKIPMRYNYKLK